MYLLITQMEHESLSGNRASRLFVHANDAIRISNSVCVDNSYRLCLFDEVLRCRWWWNDWKQFQTNYNLHLSIFFCCLELDLCNKVKRNSSNRDILYIDSAIIYTICSDCSWHFYGFVWNDMITILRALFQHLRYMTGFKINCT